MKPESGQNESEPVELLHMCTRAEWERAQEIGERIPDRFAAEGFVHMSTPYQVHLPANRIFAGRDDVVLLTLDPALLGADVKWEPGVPADPDSMRFPHLFGPIPVGAVMSVTEYRPDVNGVFPALR
ncbi:DUF952 domain-containing protein [Rhodococcus sp. ARC_M6]|uniref:DUF952 domain-containing protein n=1 Tax=Rhodococcus sp. ARC_M6 TaxID=2928852 RepID=UPI001FB460A1|nr:DUF952 domain-containing protein [Rhodococcus sp. ARC_M6]MCJ0902656.1 DUF952 domain-containing protein [Rhodococcus sp. ARC_M6]